MSVCLQISSRDIENRIIQMLIYLYISCRLEFTNEINCL